MKKQATTYVDFQSGAGSPGNRCGDCIFFSDGVCSNTKVQLDPNVPATGADKTPDADDWCDQFTFDVDKAARPKEFRKFVRFAKVQEVEGGKCIVSGICTSEAVDAEGEICDYKSSKPYYQKWSEGALKRSQGKSLGNVREMHGNSAVGVVKNLNFNDNDREVWISALIVDPVAVQKCIEGVYTGFSHGGSYVKVWEDGEFRRYTADPCEQSIVDNPANPAAGFTSVEVIKLANAAVPSDATYQYVAANGSTELRKFKTAAGKVVKQKEVKMQKAPKYLVIDDDGKGHLPYTDDNGKVSHRRMGAAWAALHGGYRGKKYEGPDKQKAIERLKEIYDQEGMDLPNAKAVRAEARAAVAAAVGEWLGDYLKRKHAKSKDARVVALTADAKKLSGLSKGMYEVGSFASLLMSLASLRVCAEQERTREDDDSTLPEDLQAELESLADTFLAMAEEEAEELVAAADAAGKQSNSYGGFYMGRKTGEIAKAAAEFQNVSTEFNKALSRFAKIVGTEEANQMGSGEPKSIDPEKEGTENIQRAVQAAVKAALKDLGVEKAKAKSQSQSASASASASSAMQHMVHAAVQRALKEAGVTKAKAASKSGSKSASASQSGSAQKVKAAVEAALKAAGITKAAKSKSASASKSASKAMTADDINKAVETGIQKGLEAIVSALAGQADDAAAAGTAAQKATPAAGIGDRNDVPAVVKGGGPVVKVVEKKNDTALEPDKTQTVEKADVGKALTGDTSEALKLMKGAKVTQEIPATLAGTALGKR